MHLLHNIQGKPEKNKKIKNIGWELVERAVMCMQNRSERIRQILLQEYGFEVCDIHKMATGVGGDTFFINTHQGRFIYKIVDANEMNHPEEEPEICSFLLQRGLEVSDFLKNTSGNFVTPFDGKKVSHVQKYVEGKVFAMNEAADWFMAKSPLLLGRIHNELREYKNLPVGIGEDFFRYMTPENAKNSYWQSYELAKQRGENDILDDLEFRLKIVQKIRDWKFDMQKLTYCNSHGDYTVNQIICGEGKINAVIDWTCACQHPVIWEITRSFFYAEPSCVDGKYDEVKFKEYVGHYCSVASLTQYDKDNLIKLYLYQLAVCDYYSQYLNADNQKKDEYLLQARFATKVLHNI